MNETRMAELRDQRFTLVEYMRHKITEEDWHGAADAANDLRCVDTELAVLMDLPSLAEGA